MQIVAARLGLHRDHPGHCFAELGVVILQCDLGLSDRFKVRIHHDNSQDRILIICPVQFEGRTAEMLAVHKYLLAALRILCRGVAPSN